MLDKLEVERLLPHSGQMVFIDRVLEHDDVSIVTEVDVDSLEVLVSERGVPAYVGIELMAQSIAAWSGLVRKSRNKPPQPGFLLGTRKYECEVSFFPRGSTLRIYAEEIINNEGLATFGCRLHYIADTCDGDLVAEARISVYSEQEENVD